MVLPNVLPTFIVHFTNIYQIIFFKSISLSNPWKPPFINRYVRGQLFIYSRCLYFIKRLYIRTPLNRKPPSAFKNISPFIARNHTSSRHPHLSKESRVCSSCRGVLHLPTAAPEHLVGTGYSGRSWSSESSMGAPSLMKGAETVPRFPPLGAGLTLYNNTDKGPLPSLQVC